MNTERGTIIFYTVEAFGHINPLLHMATEMQKRGFRVVMLTTFPMQWSEQVKQTGIELDYCCDRTVEERNALLEKMLDQAVKASPLESFRGMFKHDGVLCSLLDTYLAKEVDVEAKLHSYKADLLVYDQVFGLPILTQAAPKWVRVFSGFPSELFRCYNDHYVSGMGLRLEEMTSEMKKEERKILSDLRSRLREHWKSRGYAALDWSNDLDLSPSSQSLNFYFGPKDLGLEKIEGLNPLPDSWFRLEHVIPKTDTRRFAIPDCLANLPGKLIYFSLGSTCICNQEGLNRQNRLLDIMSKSPHRFIVSMGQMHEQVRLHPNMWGREFVDQKAILPIIDLYITHGGHNSTMEAFYYGVPAQIVVPIAADQFDCAQRIEDCGFGKRLSFYECTEEELLGSIESLLANQELKNSMRAIGDRLRSIDYIKVAADKLGEMIGSRSNGVDK